MTHGITAMQIALLISTLLMPIVGLGFLWVARKSLGGLLLGLTVGLWGLHFLVIGTGMAMIATGQAAGAALPLVVAQVLFLAMAGTMVAFGIVYPGTVLTRGHKLALGATAAGFGALAAYAIASWETNVSFSGPTDAYWQLQDLGFYTALLVVVVLLGRRWLASPAGARRTQIAWGLIPFIFWSLMEGLVFVVYPLFFGPRHELAWLVADPVPMLARAAVLAAGAFGLYLAIVATRRVLAGDPAPDERALSFATLWLLPVTLLPVLDPVYGTGQVPQVHPLVMNLFVFLVVYAVARYQIVDLDLKVKWGLEKSTLLGAFGVVFLVVSEAVEALLGIEGAVFGIGAAVVIGLFFRRLERGVEQVADRVLPGVEDTPEHLEQRRATIYRAQVESLLADGQVSGKEQDALARLREDLALDVEEAERIEARVLQVGGSAG